MFLTWAVVGGRRLWGRIMRAFTTFSRRTPLVNKGTVQSSKKIIDCRGRMGGPGLIEGRWSLKRGLHFLKEAHTFGPERRNLRNGRTHLLERQGSERIQSGHVVNQILTRSPEFRAKR